MKNRFDFGGQNRLKQLLTLSALLLLVCYCVSLGAAWIWFADLLRPFVFQYFIFSLFVGIASVITKQRVIALLMLITAVGSGYEYFSNYRPATPAISEEYTIVQFNKHGRNKDINSVVSWLSKKPGDIIVLQEVLNSDVEYLKSTPELRSLYKYRYPAQRKKNLDIYILSNIEMKNGELLDLAIPEGTSKALRILMAPTDAPVFRLYALHTARPLPADEYKRRNAQLKAIAKIIAADKISNKVLVGDLNITPWSPAFQDFTEVAGLEYYSTSILNYTSWPSYTGTPLLQIPIDHILASRTVNVIKRKAGPFLRSDHRPLFAVISLQHTINNNAP